VICNHLKLRDLEMALIALSLSVLLLFRRTLILHFLLFVFGNGAFVCPCAGHGYFMSVVWSEIVGAQQLDGSAMLFGTQKDSPLRATTQPVIACSWVSAAAAPVRAEEPCVELEELEVCAQHAIETTNTDASKNFFIATPRNLWMRNLTQWDANPESLVGQSRATREDAWK